MKLVAFKTSIKISPFLILTIEDLRRSGEFELFPPLMWRDIENVLISVFSLYFALIFAIFYQVPVISLAFQLHLHMKMVLGLEF